MQKTPDGIRRQAVFDPAGRYRYSLRRRWDAAGARVAFVLLNPSTADGRRDDPTIRRCIGFAREWGFGGLEVVNLFACRSTHPGGLRSAQDPVGPENDRFLAAAWDRADQVIVAWGNHGALLGREGRVLELASRGGIRLQSLGLTKAGQPRHVLYLRKDTAARPFPQP